MYSAVEQGLLMKMSEKKLFARKATGLVREIGPLTAVIIILCNVMGLGWQKRIFQFTGAAPLPENLWLAGIPPMLMAFIVCGIVILLSVFAFSILIAAMPRSGGGYVVISRLIGPFWAFVSSWWEFLTISFSFGIIAVAVFEGIFFIFGPIVGITAAGVTDVALFGGGILLVILFTAIGSLGIRLAGQFLQIMFWVPAVLTIYIIYLLATALANPTALSTGITMLGTAQGFSGVTAQSYVTAALNQGLDAAGASTISSGGYWFAVATAMVGAYFAYVGYAASTFVAGEVKEANKTLPRVLVLSSVIILCMYVLVSSLAAYGSAALAKVTLPNGDVWSFFEAYAWMSYGGGHLANTGLPLIKAWSTTIAATTGIGLGLSSLNWLVLIFAIFWIANDIPPFILTGSRILFAMGFDRVLPNWIANVNERFHSPVNATIIVGIFAIFGCFSESGVISFGGSWSPGMNWLGSGLNFIFSTGVGSTDIYDATFFSLFALSLVFLPFRKSAARIYETAPVKYGGKMGMALIGVVGLCANLYIAYMIITAEYQAGWMLLATGVIAALIYVYYKYGKSKEVDYSTIFAQIPPE
jgi:amino acid transporter